MGRSWPATLRRRRTGRCRRPGKLLAEAAAADAAEDARYGTAAGPVTPRVLAQRAGRQERLAAARDRLAGGGRRAPGRAAGQAAGLGRGRSPGTVAACAAAE